MTKTKKRAITVQIDEELFRIVRKEAEKNTPKGSLRPPMSTTVEELLRKGLIPPPKRLIVKDKKELEESGTIIDQWLSHYQACKHLVNQEKKYSDYFETKKSESGLSRELKQLFLGCLLNRDETELLKLLPVVHESRSPLRRHKSEFLMIKPILQNPQTLQWLDCLEFFIHECSGIFPYNNLMYEYLPESFQDMLCKKTRRWIREHTDLLPIPYESAWEEVFLLNDSFNVWLHRFVCKYAPKMYDDPILLSNSSWEMKSYSRYFKEEEKKYATYTDEWKLESKNLSAILCFETIYLNLKPLVRIPRWIDEINLLKEKSIEN